MTAHIRPAKGFLTLLFILMALMGWLVIGCNNQANAENNTDRFLQAARDAGYTQENSELLRNGFLICATQSQNGVNDDIVLRGIEAAQRWLNRDANEEKDQVFIDLSEEFLCPQEAE